MAHPLRVAPLAAAFIVVFVGYALAEPAPAPEAPAARIEAAPESAPPPVTDPLPPPEAGRTVIADVPTTLGIDIRPEDPKVLAAEDWDVIAEINRAPSTWQSYLLYTSEDLPERLFHPGFTFVLDKPKKEPVVLAPVPKPAGPPEN